MRDPLALLVEVGEGAGADLLRVVGEGLAGAQALGAAVEAVGAGEQLLALLELQVRGAGVGVVGVAGAEEGGAVVGEGAQLALVAVHVGFEVAEALVYLGARGGGDVLLFETHLSELEAVGVSEGVACRERYGGGEKWITSSSASSRARSAAVMAAFRGSPFSSGIWSSFWVRSAWTSLNSAS